MRGEKICDLLTIQRRGLLVERLGVHVLLLAPRAPDDESPQDRLHEPLDRVVNVEEVESA